MKKRQISTISLATWRANQLRQIANVHGLSIADLIASFIESEIEKGTIPDGVPGFSISKYRQSVKIELGKISVTFKRDLASQISEGLKRIATTPWTSMEYNGRVHNSFGQEIFAEGDQRFVAFRRGRGVIIWIAADADGSKETVSLNVDAALKVSEVISVLSKS